MYICVSVFTVSMQPVAPKPEMTPKVKLNWLNDSTEAEFELADIHFHWGDHNKKGSEHLLNGERSEAEVGSLNKINLQFSWKRLMKQ